MKLLRFAFCLFALVLVAGISCPARDNTVASKDLAQKQFEDVRIEEENIGALFSHFSSAYNLRIGLEIARNGDELTSYRFILKKGTLADLLNQFVAEHKQYTWTIENGILSVFPTYEYRDPLLAELLTTNISSFSIKEKTTTWGFGEDLVATPEIKRILELRGVSCDVGYLGGFYIQQLGQEFTLEVSNVTLKSLLDQVLIESPVAKHWVIANKNSTKRILLRVHAGLEYSPKETRTPE